MSRVGYDVRAICDGRGAVAGYVWQKRGRTAWGAILEGYCSCCAPEKYLGSFTRARGRRRGRRRPQGGIAAMTHNPTSPQSPISDATYE